MFSVLRLSVWIKVFVVLCYVCSAGIVNGGDEASLPVLETKTKQVIVFKNGLGFFIDEGKTDLKDGWAVIDDVPTATLGSIWLGTLNKGAELTEAVAYKQEVPVETEATTIPNLLMGNLNSNVRVLHKEKEYEGKIIFIPEDKKPSKEVRNNPQYKKYIPPHLTPKPTTLVILKTKDGEVALDKNAISSIEFLDDTQYTYNKMEEQKRIKFHVSPNKSNADIRVSYLRKGIIWSPSYLVNIENPKNARITLKATLTNEVGNLENSDVTFVVGYPNFLFSDIKSPMTLDESIEEFLRAVEAGGGRRESYGQANITRQVHARGGFESAQLPPLDYGYASAKGTPGQFEEDLFFYRKDDVNLNEEERAYYQLFSDLVPYSHIYEWEIPDVTDKKQSYNPNEKEEEVPVVWHSIKLKNSTDYPWTTAPAFTVKGIDPLAQDVIKYTPKGSEAILRLTLATDVKAYGSEKETNRQKRMRRFNSYDWDLVTIKGKLKVKNFKSEKITISIKKYITGEVLEASYNATIEKTVEDLTYNNIKSLLSWELPVDPKNELNISYTYQVFVR